MNRIFGRPDKKGAKCSINFGKPGGYDAGQRGACPVMYEVDPRSNNTLQWVSSILCTRGYSVKRQSECAQIACPAEAERRVHQPQTTMESAAQWRGTYRLVLRVSAVSTAPCVVRHEALVGMRQGTHQGAPARCSAAQSVKYGTPPNRSPCLQLMPLLCLDLGAAMGRS